MIGDDDKSDKEIQKSHENVCSDNNRNKMYSQLLKNNNSILRFWHGNER